MMRNSLPNPNRGATQTLLSGLVVSLALTLAAAAGSTVTAASEGGPNVTLNRLPPGVHASERSDKLSAKAEANASRNSRTNAPPIRELAPSIESESLDKLLDRYAPSAIEWTLVPAVADGSKASRWAA